MGKTTPRKIMCCDGLSCYDAREEIYDPRCGCCCHKRNALLKSHGELLKAAKTLAWGSNRIVKAHWENLENAMAKAEELSQ